MKNGILVDIIGVAAIIAWIVVSAYFVVSHDAEFFQRMSAAGVAVAVAYFALVRHGSTNPAGLIEQLYWISRTQLQQGEAIHMALTNTAKVSAYLKAEAEKEGKSVPNPIIELAKPLPKAVDSTAQIEIRNSEIEQKLRSNVDAANSADEYIDKVRFRSDILQAVVVVAATIQWGFGDLLMIKECSPC